MTSQPTAYSHSDTSQLGEVEQWVLALQPHLRRAHEHPTPTASNFKAWDAEAIALFDKLLKQYINLIARLAREQHAFDTDDLTDLMQEGILGLIDAIRTYNPASGARFTTYAYIRIRFFIQRAFPSLRERGPRRQRQARQKRMRIEQFCQQFYSQHHREPTIDEIAEALHLNQRHVMALKQNNVIVPLSALNDSNERCDQSVELNLLATSSFDPLRPIADQDTVTETIVENTRLRLIEALGTFIDRLPPLKRDILNMRFGFRGFAPMRYADIAEQLEIPQHQVARLAKEALSELRAMIEQSPHFALLRDLLD